MLVHPPSTSQQASTLKQEMAPPMDPPAVPLPTAPTAVATTIVAAAPTTSVHLNYPDSVESSPRSRNDHTYYDDPLPAVPGARLRLMCSFGGHIMPRPHDKSLRYVGGETRLVTADRHCSLSAFCNRLSTALLNGRPFILKYQLPNEDLDSLVSVATDEDLENMIEEYDRLIASSASSITSSRIRLFLFFKKPDTAASMGPMLNDAKSETWFIDALNGSGLIPRGNSDSATMETLLNLDGDEFEAGEGADEPNRQAKSNNDAVHEVQYSLPDSPMMENTSSFSSSSPSSTANLPLIGIRVDQVGGANIHKQDDGYGATVSALAHNPASLATVMVAPTGGSSDNLNRILSDDERSDHGVPVGFRKPRLPLLPVQPNACGTNYNLPSPQSVASDSTIASANSLSKPTYYQDQTHAASRDGRTAVSPNANGDNPIPSSQIRAQQVHDSYGLSPQLNQQQQQIMQASMHYMPHPAASAPVPRMSSCYPVYAPPSQSQHQQFHHLADQQYPAAVYAMPYMSMQSSTGGGVINLISNPTDASIMAPIPPSTPLTPSMVTASGAYKEAAALAKREMTAATVHRTAAVLPLSHHQVAQNQQPYVGFSQMQQHLPQSAAVIHPAAATNYGYEYPNLLPDQMYYRQHQAPSLPP